MKEDEQAYLGQRKNIYNGKVEDLIDGYKYLSMPDFYILSITDHSSYVFLSTTFCYIVIDSLKTHSRMWFKKFIKCYDLVGIGLK